MEGGQASSEAALTPVHLQEAIDLLQKPSTPPARPKTGSNENQDGQISSSNNAALLFGHGAQYSGSKIAESEGFFDAPPTIGSANRHIELANQAHAHSLANGIH